MLALARAFAALENNSRPRSNRMAAQKAKTGNYQNQRLNHIRQTAHLYILSKLN
jgi:hypothetical protein